MLVKNAVNNTFGQIAHVGKGTIWALPAFTDNAVVANILLERLAILNDLREENENLKSIAEKIMPTPIAKDAPKQVRDVFISHASEDKRDIARPLAEALKAQGISVWFDEYEFVLGDSLRRKIDMGLSASRHGLTILSPNFFKKEWPQKELDALFALENSEKRILPIWHNLTVDEIKKYAPLMADKYAARSSEGIDAIVQKVVKALKAS